jgi:modulator of FtsH protease
MQVAARKRAVEATVGLLCAFGVVMGVAVAPALMQYVHADPGAVWQAAGAAALFIAGLGAAGYGVLGPQPDPLRRVADG